MKGRDYRPRDYVNSTLLKTKPRWHRLLTPPPHMAQQHSPPYSSPSPMWLIVVTSTVVTCHRGRPQPSSSSSASSISSHPPSPLYCRAFLLLLPLAGNVADMSRHVGQDTLCRSNFGQMGPCRRHKIDDVVAVCVGSSRHLPYFPKCVCRNILWYGSTYAQILSHLSMLISVCRVLQFFMFWRVTTHTHTTPTRENTHNSITQ